MPNGDNWQGDVLRDLRGGAAPRRARSRRGRAAQAGARRPRPGTPARGDPRQRPRPPGTPRTRSTRRPAPPRGPRRHRPATRRAGRDHAPAARRRAPPTPGPWWTRTSSPPGRKPRHGESFAARATRALRRTVSSSAAPEVADITAQRRGAPAARDHRPADRRDLHPRRRRQVDRRGAARHHVRALPAGPGPARRGRPGARLPAAAARRRDAALDHRRPRRTSSNRRCRCSTSPAISSSCPTTPGCCPAARGRSARCSTSGVREGHGLAAPLLRRHRRRLRDAARRGRPGRAVRRPGPRAAAPATLEGVTSTYAVLEWMQRAARTSSPARVVVLTDTRPHTRLDLDAAAEKLHSPPAASVRGLPVRPAPRGRRHRSVPNSSRTSHHGRPPPASPPTSSRLSQKRH